jgi:outer membrane protein
MADFQKKLENNVFATRERAESEQARIIKRQEEYARLEQRLAGEIAAEEQKNSIALRDSINNFMKEYNATHGYDIILSRMGENILFANEALDITKEVIDGLNNRYKDAE